MYIPVIDYFDPDSPTQFTQSLIETGFAIIENHPLDQALIDYAYSEWFKFFKLSEEEKAKYAFDSKRNEGFSCSALSETAKGYKQKDLKEFYNCYSWGRCPENLRQLTNDLSSQMINLAITFLTWIDNSLPLTLKKSLPMPLSEMVKDSPRTFLRLIHYPPLTGQEQRGAIRAAAHEDINFLTVLPAATADGLQVMDKKGNWHDVPCDARRIIVNSGDMLQECTEGYFKSTTHRVMNPLGDKSKQSRLSMPLFLHPRDEIRLSDRYTAGSYLHERLKENGLVETAET